MVFIIGLIKLWRAISVGRLQTEYAVNRLLIEKEIRGLEERTVEERYEREEQEEGGERGIVMSAEPHFTPAFDQTLQDPPRHVTPVAVKLSETFRSVTLVLSQHLFAALHTGPKHRDHNHFRAVYFCLNTFLLVLQQADNVSP